MLGCVSLFLPMDVDIWKDCISQRLSPNIMTINIGAFDKGREEMSGADIR